VYEKVKKTMRGRFIRTNLLFELFYITVSFKEIVTSIEFGYLVAGCRTLIRRKIAVPLLKAKNKWKKGNPKTP
jgi:hypothetical protein